MNRRATFVLGMLTAGLSLLFVPRASADPPPWAGVWRHNKHVDGEHYARPYWRGHDHDGDDDDRRSNDWDDYRYRRDGHRHQDGYRRYDPEYAKLMDRMAYDRAKIAEIAPTGRHRKALQWYKDDLQNARRDVYNYRYRGAGYDSPPPAYDPYYEPIGSYDPYSGDAGRSFDWKRDWPMLLDQFLVQGR